jgi:hypothetical protein
MSIPYTSGDFTSARANGESWVEYPFIEYGDNTTKVYHLVCEVNEADYAPIALDTTMANATNADVIELPFAADAAAYHVGSQRWIRLGLKFSHFPGCRQLLAWDHSFQ